MTSTRVATSSPTDVRTPPGDARLVVDPSRRLPGGRALLGGVLVASAAVGLFAASRPHPDVPSTAYLVARHDLTPGHRIRPGDLSAEAIDLPGATARATVAEGTPVVGDVVLLPIAAGTLVTDDVLAPRGRPTDRSLLSFSIEPERAAAGDLVVGDRVDVLVTWAHGDDRTEVVGHDLLVAAVTRPDDEAIGASALLVISVMAPRGSSLVTLTKAIRAGELTVVRTTGTTTR